MIDTIHLNLLSMKRLTGWQDAKNQHLFLILLTFSNSVKYYINMAF
jgi:hypothetical protein